MSGADPRTRPVRSFVLRKGRMTPAQHRAYETHWSRWGVDFRPGRIDLDALFGRAACKVLEVGFGMGEALAAMAAAAPDTDFLGIEVHPPGVGKLLHRIGETGLSNVRVMRHDAVEVLEVCIAPAALDALQVFFPDPWHKKRHHKRRLIQPAFAALAASRLRPGGELRLATDWEPYAQQMLAVLSACDLLANTAPGGGYAPRPAARPPTRFERRGERLGHGIRDLVFRRRG